MSHPRRTEEAPGRPPPSWSRIPEARSPPGVRPGSGCGPSWETRPGIDREAPAVTAVGVFTPEVPTGVPWESSGVESAGKSPSRPSRPGSQSSRRLEAVPEGPTRGTDRTGTGRSGASLSGCVPSGRPSSPRHEGLPASDPGGEGDGEGTSSSDTLPSPLSHRDLGSGARGGLGWVARPPSAAPRLPWPPTATPGGRPGGTD